MKTIRNHWLVFLKDGHEVPVTYVDAVSHDQVMLDYRDAYAAMPWAGPEPQNQRQTGNRLMEKATTPTKAPTRKESSK